MTLKEETMFSFRLDKHLLDEFQAFAKEQERSASAEIRKMMRQALRQRVDGFDNIA